MNIIFKRTDQPLAYETNQQMTNYYVCKPIYALLMVVAFLSLTACKGQSESQSQTDRANATSANSSEHPKMLRTLGNGYTQVGCGFQDRAGNLWFGTLNEGVYRYDGKTFTQFTVEDGLKDNAVNDIIEDKNGHILLGTNAGICRYDGQIFTPYFEADTLNKLRITTLLEARDGSIWFGAMNRGVYRFDGTNLSTILYKYGHVFFAEKFEKMISDILQDRNGNIWFSSFNRGGVWRYDGKVLSHFLPSPDYYQFSEDESSNSYVASNPQYVHSPDFITDDMIQSMTEDKAGNILFATRRHGVCLYDGKSFTSFIDNEAFVSNGVISMREDKNGNMWFTTDKKGVFCYDGENLKNYSTADGLVNNSVRFALEDKNGNLWFGTRGFGLNCYDGKTFVSFSDYKEE